MQKESKLKLAIAMSSGFLVVEVLGGYIANSLAIYSDAAHLLTDIAGFAISLLAVLAAKRPGCKDYTYGMVRAEVFGALASIFSLWIITAILVYQAYYRALAWFQGDAEEVNGKLMFFVAVFGVFVNICLGFVFSSEHGGAFHPAHSHGEHGHCSDHNHSSAHNHHDIEAAGGHGHDHGPDSNHDKASHSEHDHGHNHAPKNHVKESSSLITAAPQKTGYTQISAEDDGHSHGHNAPCNGDGHDHGSSSMHAEEEGGHGDDHDSHGGHGDHKEPQDFDANIQAAYLHVLTDLIQSIGVAIAGMVIWMKPTWQVIDPLCTFLFSILVLSYTVPLINRIANVLLEGKPPHIDWHVLESRLRAIDGVQDVHDLHIWSISSNTCAMTVHIRAYNPQSALIKAHKICKDMSIQHPTIQVQDAAAGNSQQCLSEMCEQSGTCVIPTPSNYLTGGF